MQKFNEQRKGVRSSGNISRIFVTNSSFDPEQLKKARDDIKELIKETYCSPILVYNGKFCLGLGLLILTSTFTFISSFSHWDLNVQHDLDSCCNNFKGNLKKYPCFTLFPQMPLSSLFILNALAQGQKGMYICYLSNYMVNSSQSRQLYALFEKLHGWLIIIFLYFNGWWKIFDK